MILRKERVMRALSFGSRIFNSLSSMPSCMLALEKWGEDINPASFNPMVPLKCGYSFVSRGAFGKEIEALVAVENWLDYCAEMDVKVKHSLICLAANFDECKGVISVVLEAALANMISQTYGSLCISDEEWVSLIGEIFMRNYAGITDVAIFWGINSEELGSLPPAKTRKYWSKKYGHDVLINPVTLRPCKDEKGRPLEFLGFDKEEGRDVFVFGSTYNRDIFIVTDFSSFR